MATRASKKDREEFVAVLVRECPTLDAIKVAQVAGRIMRHASTLGRLAEESCNGHPAQGSPTMPADQLGRLQDRWDARIEKESDRMERLIQAAATELGLVAKFDGDPRGCTVKLILPSKRYNTWGGEDEGWGVPGS